MSEYRNYYLISDENTVLRNPHKGWYFHFLDNGYPRPTYRDEENIDEALDMIPGLNHLYLRFDWLDIEKEKGVYDWSYLDGIIEKYRKKGYKFSLRLCTFETNGVTPAVIPDYVKNKINGYVCKNPGGDELFEPDYSDEYFLEALDVFMAEYARKFDGHPDIEYIDIGTFGTWGEGHTSSGSGTRYPYETIMKHTNLHLKHFKRTQLMLNDDMYTHVSHTSKENAERFLQYCIGKGIGIRDDGIMVKYYSDTFGYHTLKYPDLFRLFTVNAPCDIESEHYSKLSKDYFKDGLPLLEAVRRSKASYAGFHGYAAAWIGDNKYLADYIANRLGYWYFIKGAEIPECISGCTSVARFHIENKGFSRAYHRYDLDFFAISEDGKKYKLNASSPDNTRWEGETVNVETVRLDFEGVPSGSYKLCVRMHEGDTPVKLGIRDEYMTSDGGYIIDTLKVGEIGEDLL